MNKINFKNIIKELKKSGYTDALLAHECDCSQTYIGQLAKGKSQPGYDIGDKLVTLHGELE